MIMQRTVLIMMREFKTEQEHAAKAADDYIAYTRRSMERMEAIVEEMASTFGIVFSEIPDGGPLPHREPPYSNFTTREMGLPYPPEKMT